MINNVIFIILKMKDYTYNTGIHTLHPKNIHQH